MTILDNYMFRPLLAIFMLSLRELKVLLYNVRIAREILAEKGGTVGEKSSVILPKFRLTLKFRDLLHAANLRHGIEQT